MGLEYEIKLIPTKEKSFLQLEAAMTGDVHHYEMETTYYDTPDRALRKQSITLRKRMENGKAVCTMKTPGVLGRNEYELECDTIEAALPELCRLAQRPELEALLQQGVEPVCGAAFHRTAVRIQLADSLVEVCYDRGQLLGGGRTAPLMEMEIELIEGSPRGVERLAHVVCNSHDFEIETKSKYARAYALAEKN